MVHAVRQGPEELHRHEVRSLPVRIQPYQNATRTNPFRVITSLALMEIHLTLANFFGRFEMELFETDEKSMEWRAHGTAVNASNVKVRARPLVL